MTANTYHQISRDEFENVLRENFDAYAGVDVPGTKELVYDLPTDHEGYVVRVFSTLTRDGSARDSGADAIRVLLWSRDRDAPAASATRTNRIETWASNFVPKVEAMFDAADEKAAEDAARDATVTSALASLVTATGDDDEITVVDLIDTKFGRKAALDTPYAAKDDVKALDWDDTHRAWDADRKKWTVDADALPLVRDELAEAGWTLVRPNPVDESFDARAFADDASITDDVTITYEAKTSGNEKQVSGTVFRAEGGRVGFRRHDDDHPMYVTEDGLFTARSQYPFVGTVVDAEVR